MKSYSVSCLCTKHPYDTYPILEQLVDGGEYDEYKAGYGKTIITAYARIDGWAVGIVANQRKVMKSKKEKCSWVGLFMAMQPARPHDLSPTVTKENSLGVLQDVTGFMVGSQAEHGGIIKDGAKMVNAMANSVVPKFTVILGNSYGAGNYAMCGKAFDPRFIVAWPSAEKDGGYGRGTSSQGVDANRVEARLEKKVEISEKEQAELFDKIKGRYDVQTKPEYGAARLWTDAIIHPLDTRKWISMGIEAANHAPISERFNMGVLQV